VQARREIGRAGKSDAQGMLDPEIPQSSDPSQDRRTIEADLSRGQE